MHPHMIPSGYEITQYKENIAPIITLRFLNHSWFLRGTLQYSPEHCLIVGQK